MRLPHELWFWSVSLQSFCFGVSLKVEDKDTSGEIMIPLEQVEETHVEGTLAEEVIARQPAKTAKVGLAVFFNIMNAWQVKAKEQIVLLGSPAESTFYNWKKGKVVNLSQDTLERISYILGIYKALGILFPSRTQADAWPKKPNKAFNDMSALEFMLKGNMIHLSDMRRYLDAQRG